MCKVSVIIPYYNREKTIKRCLESVIKQTFKDFEVILIDDGSSDKTNIIVDDFINKYNNYLAFKHIKQNNMGVSAARNNGIMNAKGKFVAFLDSDDSWEKDKLEKQIGFMERNPQYKITSTNYNIILKNNVKIKEHYIVNNVFKEGYFLKMLFKVFYCMPTIIVERDVLIRDGIYFKEGKHQAEDHLFCFEIMSRYKGAKLMAPLCNIYKLEYGQGGLSGDLSLLVRNELENFKYLFIHKKINLPVYILTIIVAYFKHVKRKLRILKIN